MKLPWQPPAPPPFYQFVHASQMPTPGAMAFGFESEAMPWRPMIGPAIGVRQQFASFFATPGVYQSASMAWIGGLTGIVQGQNALQPLSNPYKA
jgi:hypothetical protein